ncbi:Uncharacterised protein [Citrobacter youngae]|uniref:Uncharacterized protein n=1 Tax=Citrobacter youngae TaxID=133448 RepID=A0A9Q8E9E5_9ENTR|nr:hypothetical protein SK32_01288 [Citrobacter sp. MGH100]SUX81444.1 Uncharacterised protein [Citrobacter youngae]SUY01494.1 Uncharacterised protein [Citrobacter youngae]VEI42054.1 Uncharacterised protein [Citrobacter youngae]
MLTMLLFIIQHDNVAQGLALSLNDAQESENGKN